jgi:hypothetical protein
VRYMQFVVWAFEREPGKWRASVERANGKALLRARSRRRKAFNKFINGMDAMDAEAATRMAIAAIDANAFSRISTKDKRQARAGLHAIEVRGQHSANLGRSFKGIPFGVRAFCSGDGNERETSCAIGIIAAPCGT